MERGREGNISAEIMLLVKESINVEKEKALKTKEKNIQIIEKQQGKRK